jgi:acyl-CoA thioesterase I
MEVLVADFTQQELAYLVQFIHPQKHFLFLPGSGDAAAAAFFGMTPEEYCRIREGYAEQARCAAEEMLADAEFATQIDALPFAPGAKVVAFGDSITDDLQSWCEILRHALAMRRPADRIDIANAAISGDTTANLICRFLDVVNLEPDWILFFGGTNDAREHGLQPAKTLVSIDETKANLAMLREYAARQTAARWVWMTPATVVEQSIPEDWWLGAGQLMWRNRNLRPIVDAVIATATVWGDPVVNLQVLFGDSPAPGLLQQDGLHPALAGQELILRALLDTLTE